MLNKSTGKYEVYGFSFPHLFLWTCLLDSLECSGHNGVEVILSSSPPPLPLHLLAPLTTCTAESRVLRRKKMGFSLRLISFTTDA